MIRVRLIVGVLVGRGAEVGRVLCIGRSRGAGRWCCIVLIALRVWVCYVLLGWGRGDAWRVSVGRVWCEMIEGDDERSGGNGGVAWGGWVEREVNGTLRGGSYE